MGRRIVDDRGTQGRASRRKIVETDPSPYLCPACRTTRLQREIVCGYCRYDIRQHRQAGFDMRLIRALGDAEPETVMRAAFLLGIRQPVGALDALLCAYEGNENPFVQRQILAALDTIGGDRAAAVLRGAAESDSIILRAEALGRLIVHEGSTGPTATRAVGDPSAYVRWMVHRAVTRR